MRTPLDRALNSPNLLLGFAGIITAVAAWGIWGGDMFPVEPDPSGSPENWTVEEMRRWLRNRSRLPDDMASREELLERVRANMRPSSNA